MIGEFIILCFHARTNAHVLHLQTRSYAAHKALNEFYDEIVELADRLVLVEVVRYHLHGAASLVLQSRLFRVVRRVSAVVGDDRVNPWRWVTILLWRMCGSGRRSWMRSLV